MAETTRMTGLGTVAKVVDEYTVVINRGVNDGVSIGARFLIYGVGEEITDPETNESLGALELVRGIGSVTHVQERLSTITSSKTRGPASTVRTIKRNPRLALAFGDETVEERQGEPTVVPFDGAQMGDRARPL